MVDLILKDEVYAVVGAATRVLGRGFLEGVYQDAMQLELIEAFVDVEYKGQCLTTATMLVCFGQVIVELKALSRLSGNEEAQVLNYLKATDFKGGRPGKLNAANTLANGHIREGARRGAKNFPLRVGWVCRFV